MADNLTAGLGVRQANYCLAHALDAASQYYTAALPTSLFLLARAKKLCENRRATPSRVQPARSVKRRAPPPPRAPCRPKPSVESRVKRLLSEVPVPVSGGEVLSEEEWRAEVKTAVLGTIVIKRVEGCFGGGDEPCIFGERPWKCGECEREGGDKAREEGGERTMREGDGERTAEVAVMGGPVVVEGVGDGDWWGVEIPEDEVVSVGGLRFVVDVCGSGLVMFV